MSRMRVAGIIAGLLVLGLIFGGSRDQQTSYDSCKPSEADVRQYWAIAALHARKGPDGSPDASDRVHIAGELADAQANLCRYSRDAKPAPLPPALQQRVR